MLRTISWILFLLIVSGMIENGTPSKRVSGKVGDGVENQDDKRGGNDSFLFEADDEKGMVNDHSYNSSKSEENISLMSDLDRLAVFINPDNVSKLTLNNIQTICLTTLEPFLPLTEVAKLDKPTQFFNDNNRRFNYYADITENITFDHIHEFEYYHTDTKLNYIVKRYPTYMLRQFHKEIKLLYKLGSLFPNDEFGSVAYKGCAFVDSYLYVFTADTEYMYSLFSPEMLSKIAELSSSDRKNLFINLAQLLLAFYKKSITHGSITLDNILVNESLTKFKLKNFQLADDFNNNLTSFSSSNEISQLSKAGSESYYKDVIDLIFVLIYFDKNLHNVVSRFKGNSNATPFLEMPNVFTLEYIFPLMNVDRSLKVKKMKNILKELKSKNNAGQKKTEDSFISQVSNFICTGCVNKKLDNVEFNFTPLHNMYLTLLMLSEEFLDANVVDEAISSIDHTFFSTWLQKEGHSNLKIQLLNKTKATFKLNKDEEVIQSHKPIKDLSINKLIV